MEMAQPLLDFLTGRAREALPFLRQLVSQGLSTTAIISQIREQGIGFNTQRMTDVIKALQDKAKLPNYLRIVPQTTPLPTEAHTIAVVDMRSNYQYLVQSDYDPTQEPGYVTVSSAIPLSQAAILASAEILFLTEQYGPDSPEEVTAAGTKILEASINQSAPLP